MQAEECVGEGFDADDDEREMEIARQLNCWFVFDWEKTEVTRNLYSHSKGD